jgi:hypothetical protein
VGKLERYRPEFIKKTEEMKGNLIQGNIAMHAGSIAAALPFQ